MGLPDDYMIKFFFFSGFFLFLTGYTYFLWAYNNVPFKETFLDKSEAKIRSVRYSLSFRTLQINSISIVSYKLITSFILWQIGMQETLEAFSDSLTNLCKKI